MRPRVAPPDRCPFLTGKCLLCNFHYPKSEGTYRFKHAVPDEPLLADPGQIYLEEFHPDRTSLPSARPLFNSRHFGELTRLSEDSVSATLKKAGDSSPSILVKLYCHMLRKTKAMDLYKQGIPLQSSCNCSDMKV